MQPPSEIPDLTLRQLQVLKLISQGLEMKQVGARLFISRHTVKNLMIEVFNRLGVRTAAGAVGEAYRRGVLVVDSDEVVTGITRVVRRVLAERAALDDLKRDLLHG